MAQCKATIFNGNQCKRTAIEGEKFCRQHAKQAEKKSEPEKDEDPKARVREPEKQDAREVEHMGEMVGQEMVTTEDDSQVVARAMASDPLFRKYEVAKRVAHALAQSNLVPDAYRGRPNDCFVAINMGAEIGLEPFQAIQSIAVIDGKPCLYGDGLIGVVRASPLCEWIEEKIAEDGQSATCTTKRKGDRSPITATYSMADAVQAGIDTKYNWKKHPKRMLQMRARAYCLRDAYPDIMKGLGVVEEMIDHEDTPPPVQSYELPKAPSKQEAPPLQQEEEEDAPTLMEVEQKIYASKNMEQLIKAGEMAKRLTDEADKSTARTTYKRMKRALLEDANATG